MDRQKVFKTLAFRFIDIWNNIDQLQQSGSCIRMLNVDIWVRRIRAQILLEGRKCVWIVPTQIQPSDIRIQDPLCWSWSILFQISINQKSSVLNTFYSSTSDAKWMAKSSELVRSMSLDIQILDPAISSWSKHLKTSTN